MLRRRCGWMCGCYAMLVLGAGVLHGQQAESANGGVGLGSVTGHVVEDDTQRAARFAIVTLQRVVEAGSHDEGSGSSFTRTDVEGNFTVSDVAPGDYYVMATAPGYVSERALLQAGVNAGADPVALLAQVPVVHVAAAESSPVTVTIERGGTLAGKVSWEDGSAAAGISLSAVSATGSGSGQLPGVLQGFGAGSGGGDRFATTDDRGVFRISGLASGSYLLRSQIQAPPQMALGGRASVYAPPIRMYAPGVFRRADAKAFAVKAGEERTDVVMVIDLRGLHTVSGSATAAGLHVASGRVTLVDPNDSDLQLGGAILQNGDFVVRYVPEGSYQLKVTGASSAAATGRARGSQSGVVSYQPFSQAEIVGDTDVSGVGISLTPVASQP